MAIGWPRARRNMTIGGLAALLTACVAPPPPTVDMPSPAPVSQIERIEPPHWWVGFEDNELQLLVHGEGVGSLEPQINDPRVDIVRIERVENPNYLFVYLDIAANAQPGPVDILFAQGGEVIGGHRYQLDARRDGSALREGFGPSDTIYLITPDRFANGDPGNDEVAGYDDLLNRGELYGRHGGDLAGIRNNLDYIESMGFTQIWLNPVLENAMAEHSYHGYAQTDLYKVDPRYGTNEDYRALSAEANTRGIGLIKDIVLNHIGSGHWWMDDLPTPDWINHGGEYVNTTHQHTAALDPYAPDVDVADFTQGWFVPTMPDMNTDNPLLADYLIQNSIWWIEYADLSGIRLDTYAYPGHDMVSAWMDRITLEYPNFNAVGEEWVLNASLIARYQRAPDATPNGKPLSPSMMDFPLQDAMRRGLTEDDGWGSGLIKLYEVMVNDPLYPAPNELTIFVDNHDMDRIHTQMGRDPALTRMAFVWLATMRGIPQFYYGNEVLATNATPGHHGEIRSEFPGGWPDHADNAFTGEGLIDEQRQMQDFVRNLFTWRKTASAVHNGTLTHYAPVVSNEEVSPLQHTYVYFRDNGEQTIMVMLYKGDEAFTLDTERYAQNLYGASEATDVLTGRRYQIDAGLPIAPRSAMVLEIQ